MPNHRPYLKLPPKFGSMMMDETLVALLLQEVGGGSSPQQPSWTPGVRRSCQPATKIGFMKTHKTASRCGCYCCY